MRTRGMAAVLGLAVLSGPASGLRGVGLRLAPGASQRLGRPGLARSQVLASRLELDTLSADVEELSDKAPHHITFRKFKRIVKQGGDPSGVAYERVLRACKRAPSAPFTVKVCQVLAASPPADTLQGFHIAQAAGGETHPLTPLYALAMEACAEDAAPLDALRVLELMRAAQVPRIEALYADVLRAASKSRDLDAEKLAQIAGTSMRLLKNDGLAPTAAVYSMLIQVLLRAGRPDAALAAFDSISDQEKLAMAPSNWGRAILAAARTRNAERVHALVEEAWSRGVRVSVPDMKAALRCIGQDGVGHFRSDVVRVRHWRIATRLLEAIGEDAGPDEFHFAITACGRAGKGQRSLKLLAELKERLGEQVVPRKTYNSCLHATLREGMLAETEAILVEMQRKKVTFDTVTYNIMLDQYVPRGDWRSAVRTLQEMDQLEDVNPTVVSFGTVIAAAARGGVATIAAEILVRMQARGVSPNTPCFVAALEACCRDPDPELAAEAARRIGGMISSEELDGDRKELIAQLAREALNREHFHEDDELRAQSQTVFGIALEKDFVAGRSGEL